MTSKKLRIAYLDEAQTMGGAQHLLLENLRARQANSVDALVIASQENAITRQIDTLGVPVIVRPLPSLMKTSYSIRKIKVLNPFALVWNAVNLTRLALRIRHLLRTNNVDIVQTNTTFSHIYGGMAARLAGLPCIWHYHDLPQPQRLGGLIVLIWRLLAMAFATHIVGDSNAVISGLNLPRRSSTIYAGKDAIDQDEIAQAETDWLSRPGLATSTQRIIYVGRIAYNKGVDVLAEAAALLHAQFPDLHFVIVGEAGKTDQGFRRFLDQRIQQLGIAQCWHELGSRNDVLSIMTHCDIVVLPSRREAFGLVMQEAAQVARPVVGANIGGIPETMIPDETGLLFTPEDPSDLAQKIAYLLQHPEQARQMGIVGQHFVRDNFTKARYHQQFVALYNSFEAR